MKGRKITHKGKRPSREERAESGGKAFYNKMLSTPRLVCVRKEHRRKYQKGLMDAVPLWGRKRLDKGPGVRRQDENVG